MEFSPISESLTIFYRKLSPKWNHFVIKHLIPVEWFCSLYSSHLKTNLIHPSVLCYILLTVFPLGNYLSWVHKKNRSLLHSILKLLSLELLLQSFLRYAFTKREWQMKMLFYLVVFLIIWLGPFRQVFSILNLDYSHWKKKRHKIVTISKTKVQIY